jgi:pantoate--beta-alanine ligase
MLRVNTIADVREQIASRRANGQRIALVPTMGFLHEGHLSLVDHARKHAQCVVMSVFVNPLQFGPSEDLATYPRDLERDATLAHSRGTDILFAPTAEQMYPRQRPAITMVAPALSDRLCGKYRPGHFEGVLTVVAKLFNIVQPDVSVFGQKDFQQSVVIRRMVRDFDFPIEIAVAPIVREADGLAMSSRNVYLSPDERRAAATLNRALREGQSAFAAGQRNPTLILDRVNAVIGGEPAVGLQYLELVEPDGLQRPGSAEPGHVLAIAAFVGRTRLIDNVILSA